MRNIELQQSTEQSLKESIFTTIRNTKLQTVTNLLRHTRSRGHSSHPLSSHPSDLKPSAHSLNIHTELSPNRLSFSPEGPRSHKKVHRSTDSLRRKQARNVLKKRLNGPPISKRVKQQIVNWVDSLREEEKKKKRGLSSKGRNLDRMKKEEGKYSSSKSRNSKSRDRGSSKLNLSSILEQESYESKLKTPTSRPDQSRNRPGRKLSGDPTKKKERRGLREVVWRRLERSLKQPEKYHRLLKNDIMSVRFRVLRKTLLEIQVNISRRISNLNMTLHKGNLECQGVQEAFEKLQLNSSFSLYSSVRGIDLNEPLRLPQLQIEAFLNESQRFEKLVTLPYCWIHMAGQLNKPVQRSRIKTKACLQEMPCSRAALRGLVGVLPGWNCQSVGRCTELWESRLTVGDSEFELRVVQREGHFEGELSGRGEDRLIRMLQFLQELLS